MKQLNNIFAPTIKLHYDPSMVVINTVYQWMTITSRYTGLDSTMALNSNLVRSQHLSESNVSWILKLHAERMYTFHECEHDIQQCKPLSFQQIYAKGFADRVDLIDRALQAAWGFPLDELRLNWWYQIPHCACKQPDPGQVRIYNPACIIHEHRI